MSTEQEAPPVAEAAIPAAKPAADPAAGTAAAFSEFSFRSASPMISGPLGQPGDVSDMSTSTSFPFTTRTS